MWFKRPILAFSFLMNYFLMKEIQFKKCVGEILSITIGMNLWFAPQISEHWPYKRPVRLILKLVWFKRPGVPSIFTPREGIVQEWITSAEVTISRTWVIKGIVIRLSTSSSRKFDFINSLDGII